MLNILTLSLWASLLCGAQSSQGSVNAQRPEGTDVSTSVGQTVEVRYGQEVTVPGHKFKIKFVSVPEDSRCPKGVTCIWAGTVRVLLHVSKTKSKPVKVELNLNPRDSPVGQVATYGNYKLKLVSVEPYPVNGQQRVTKDYTVTLDISKK